MNLSLFTSLFKKKSQSLTLPESSLLKKLKTVVNENNLSIFENITIYHHTKNFLIPLLILDENRGIFLFEYKDWSYDDLKNANAVKANNQNSSRDTLAFEKSHTFIRRKFNEITHSDGVPIFNYLLMENINTDEYENLNASVKELLPKEKVIFSDSSHNTILGKLMKAEISEEKLPDTSTVMGTLLIQYAILNDTNTIKLASKEQMNFIDSSLLPYYVLKAPPGSGKTSSILLKAILEKLKNPKLKIIIIKPTTLSCDKLKRRLLNSIEHAIIEIDVTSIEILTPKDIINKHLSKLNQPTIDDELYINPSLINKSFNIADLIICDDSEVYSTEFMAYIKHQQSKNSLIMVENSNSLDANIFTKSFKNKHKQSYYHQANQHAKALQIISSLLKENATKDILVVANNLSQEKLTDDLEFFIRDKAVLLDSSKNLIDQDLDNLLLSSYEEINSIDVKFVVLMDICEADIKQLEYAYNLPQDAVYVLYEEECDNLALIRNNFESTKE